MIYLNNTDETQEVMIPRNGGRIAFHKPDYVLEAPKDGKTYGRKDGTWREMPSSLDTYTKSQTDTLLNAKADKSTTYTKTQTDSAISAHHDATKANVGASYTKAEEDTALAGKVDKVTGKGLSSNDFTTEEKTKLASLENYDDTALAGRVSTIEGKEEEWDAKQDAISDLATIRSNAQMAVSALHADDETASITGDWAFDGTLSVQTPTEDYEAANKEYVDTQISGLHSDIDYKADDTEVVHLTGDETIAGMKDFTECVKASTIFLPTTGDGATIFADNVDDDNLKVWVVGAGRYANIEVGRDPISENELTTKGYVDTALAAKAEKFVVKVTRTGTANTCDKTYAEIRAAYDAGKIVLLNFTNTNANWVAEGHISHLETTNIVFNWPYESTNYTFIVRSDNTYYFSSNAFALYENVGNKSNLTTTNKTNLVAAINEVNAGKVSTSVVGSLSNLTTTDKSSIVAAINEVAQGSGGGSGDSYVIPIDEEGVYLVDPSLNIGFRLDSDTQGRRAFGHWCSLGTSITAQDTTLAGVTKGYQTRVREVLSFSQFTNKGVNGGTMIALAGALTTIPNADIYTIEHGINDWGNNVSVGTKDDYINNTGNGTFFGAYRSVIDKIYTLNPSAKVILITPRKARYGTASTESLINGVALSAFADAVREIAQIESLPVCDWFGESQVNNHTIGLYSTDNLHPNDDGMQIMAEILEREFVKISNY